MNPANSVTLTGVLSRAPHPAGKVCFASIRIAEHEGRSPIIDVKAFAPQAEELAALKEGAEVTLLCHLASERPRAGSPKDARWALVVVVDEIAVGDGIGF